MIGKVVGIVLGVVVVGAVVLAFLAVVPSPATCTPSVPPVASAADARARWEAWTTAGSPASVMFTEAEATAVLRDQNPDPSIKDPVVHFCSDGTVQLSFTYPAGPVAVKGVATGTIASTSPLAVEVTSIAIGGLPSAVTDLVVGAVKDIASQVSSLGLAGPVKEVVVTQGEVTVIQ